MSYAIRLRGEPPGQPDILTRWRFRRDAGGWIAWFRTPGLTRRALAEVKRAGWHGSHSPIPDDPGPTVVARQRHREDDPARAAKRAEQLRLASRHGKEAEAERRAKRALSIALRGA